MSRKKAQRIVAIEESSGRRKAVAAELRGDRITVLGACVTDPARRDAFPAGAASRDAEVIVVADSERAVCRVLRLASGTPDQTRRMAALHLETELPYPIADTVWTCERRADAAGAVNGSVLAFAAPKSDLQSLLDSLRAAGRRCGTVHLGAAALAELALAQCGGESVLAVIALDELGFTIGVLDRGRLRYMRKRTGGVAAVADLTNAPAMQRLADELDQCLHHYAFQEDAAAPERIVLIGAADRAAALAPLVGARMGLPVETARLPACVTVSHAAVAEADLLGRYPACLGALLAAQRRLRGQGLVAPPLQQRRPAFFETALFRRAVLIAVNALLLAALVWTLFHVREARIAAATSVARESRAALEQLDRLQSDVKVLEHEAALQRASLQVIKSLAELLPPGTRILSFTLDARGHIALSGTSASLEAVSDKAVAGLTDSGLFRNVKFLNVTREKDKDGYKFSLTCELAPVRKGEAP